MLIELAKVMLAILLLNLIEGQFFIFPPLLTFGFVLLGLICTFGISSLLSRNQKLGRFIPAIAFPLALSMTLFFDYIYGVPKLICSLLGLPSRSWGLPVLIELFLFMLFWIAAHAPMVLYMKSIGLAKLRMLARFTLIPVALVVLSEMLTELYSLLPFSILFTICENPIILLIAIVFGYVAIVLLFPIILTRIFKTRPLEEGRVRTALLDLASKAGVPLRNIMVWDTDGARYHNALVSGFIGKLRYILITDALLEDFPPEYITAVFAHELSHSRKHHFKILALTGLGLFGLISITLFGLSSLDEISLSIIVLGTIALYLMLVLLPLYRTLERQADVEGAALIENPEIISQALAYLGRFMPPKKRKHSFTHYGLDKRVEVLHRCNDRDYHSATRKLLSRKIRLFIVPILMFLAFGAYFAFGSRNEIIAQHWLFVSEIALEKDNVQNSADAIEKSLALSDNNSLRIYLGLHYVDMENFEKAKSILNSCEPENSHMYAMLLSGVKRERENRIE